MRKIMLTGLGIFFIVWVGMFCAKRYSEYENERQILSDLRLLAFPHAQLHDIQSVKFLGAVNFSNLYRYSEGKSNTDFGLVYMGINQRYQVSLPSGTVYQFKDNSAWDTWRTNNLPPLQLVTTTNLWQLIETNKCRNLSSKQVRHVGKQPIGVLSSTNWLNDFWVSGDLAGGFISNTNSNACNVFYIPYVPGVNKP